MTTRTRSRLVQIFTIAVTAAMLSPMAKAAGVTSSFEGPGYELSLPGSWTVSAVKDRDGISQYRNSARAEELTVSVYALRMGQFRHAAAIQQSFDARRALELGWGQGQTTLSAITRQRRGEQQWIYYSGEDRRAQRRFLNLMVSSGACVQNFYFEAIGLPEADFARSVHDVFAAIDVPQLPELPYGFWNKTALEQLPSGAALYPHSPLTVGTK